MKHFIYKTSSTSGRFYIGRHSTLDINDGYCGSGKWVSGIKDKSKLTVEILEYANSIDELMLLEEKYLSKFIKYPNNMNFNNRSIGFATGELNPIKKGYIKSKETINKTRESVTQYYSTMSTEEKKQKFGHAGEKNGFYGKNHSAETKEKLKKAAASQDRHLNNSNAKPVTINGITYPLMKSAMVALGLNRKQLLKLLGEV